MRSFLISLLVLLGGQGVFSDSARVEEISTGITIQVQFDETTLMSILRGDLPDGLIPLGLPGEPASAAKVVHVAIVPGAHISMEIMDLSTRTIPEPLPLHPIRDLRPMDAKSLDEVPDFDIMQDPYIRDSEYARNPVSTFTASKEHNPEFITISEPKTFRQVTYVDVLIRPVLSLNSKSGTGVLQSARIELTMTPTQGHPVEDSPEYIRQYSRLFANTWKDKGGSYLPEKTVTAWIPPAHTGNAYKISVDTDGTYILTYSFLSTYAPDLITADPTLFRLYNQGAEIPIYVSGESDHIFSDGDAVYFYGEALTGEAIPGVWCAGDFTDTNVYWLIAGTQAGLRMGTRHESPVTYTTPTWFESTERFEENPSFASFQTQNDTDLWLWKRAFWYGTDASNAVQTHTVTLLSAALQPSYSAHIDFNVRGTSYFTEDPDHHVKIGINGTFLTEATFNDYDAVTLSHDFDQSILGSSGDLTINVTHEVTDPVDLSILSDSVYSNWFDITYARQFEAVNDALTFSYDPGSYRFEISNYSSDDAMVLDVTDPTFPVRLTNTSFINSDDKYTIRAYDAATTSPRTYHAAIPIAVTEGDLKADNSSLNLDDPGFVVPNWVMICPDDWVNSTGVQDLVSLRQSQGLTTMVASVEDIYDEYSYGIFTPRAIRDFLEDLYGMASPPDLQYVVLLGDSDYDYKDNAANGSYNLVPTWMVADPGFSSSAFHPYPIHSFDNYFGCFSGSDSVPEIYIGRIPARTEVEANAALGKIFYYETGITDFSWLGKTLFSADCQDYGQFEPGQDTNALYVSPIPPHSVYKMYFRLPPWNCNAKDVYQYVSGILTMTPNGISDLVDEFNEGYGIISWNGHGGFQQWGSKNYLNVTDFPGLTNDTRPAVTLNANCYTGAFYHSIVQPTFLEGLMTPATGMVGGISPGTYMFSFQDHSVLEPFYREVFGRNRERLLGALFQGSILEIASSGDQRLTEGLVEMGDPATRLAIPTPDPVKNFYISDTDCRLIQLTWDPPDPGFSGKYSIYRSEDGGTTFSAITKTAFTTFDDTDIVYGTTYDYYVAAVDDDGFEGIASNIVSQYASPCTPAVPQNPFCSNPQLGGRLDLLWDAVDEPEIETYRVYWGTTSGMYPNFTDAGNVTTYRLEGLPEGVPIYIAVAARNTFDLESVKSTQISCTSSHELGWAPPVMVYPITLTKDGSSHPVLHWDLPTEDIWGGEMTKSDMSLCSVYRSENPDFVPDRSTASADRIGTVDPQFCLAGACQFTDETPAEPAHYYVTCETSDGEESSIRNAPPNFPPHFFVQYSKGQYIITWENVINRMDGEGANIIDYYLFRESTNTFLPDIKDLTNFIASTDQLIYLDFTGTLGYFYKTMARDSKGNLGPF
ncbi:MAG TPA: C25 family cysteine peptidase [Thermoanaerobaculia bacterium]|nr:C25 family cysteine peptidase [Thermoanaerobaculia bacterium]HXK69102.1 C25 family cysteine peptidase [Thermoanaerobaculia bacterium]